MGPASMCKTGEEEKSTNKNTLVTQLLNLVQEERIQERIMTYTNTG